MSCPICTHTMSNLGLDQAARRIFWCPRCGTIKTESTEITWVEYHTPRLVERSMQLVEAVENKEHRRIDNMVRTVKETCGVPINPST